MSVSEISSNKLKKVNLRWCLDQEYEARNKGGRKNEQN